MYFQAHYVFILWVFAQFGFSDNNKIENNHGKINNFNIKLWSKNDWII